MTDWIAEARARLDKATRGPWCRVLGDEGMIESTTVLDSVDEPHGKERRLILFSPAEKDADTEFIAHSWADLRRALDALGRVQALADRLDAVGGGAERALHNPGSAPFVEAAARDASKLLRAALAGSETEGAR